MSDSYIFYIVNIYEYCNGIMYQFSLWFWHQINIFFYHAFFYLIYNSIRIKPITKVDWYSSWIPMIVNIYLSIIFKIVIFFLLFLIQIYKETFKNSIFVTVWVNFNFWRMSNVYHISNISMTFEGWCSIDITLMSK